MLEKKSVNTFHDFAMTAFKQYGMRIVIFAGFADGEGDPAISW